MKPLGTITIHFPFVDSESRGILESLMQESLNYVDFVERFCDHVCTTSSPSNLVFLTTFHIVQTPFVAKLWDQVIECYPDLLMLRPAFDIQRVTLETPIFEEPAMDALRANIQEVLSSNPEDWIALEMYRAMRHTAKNASMKQMATKKIEDLFQRNKDLECFKPGFLTSLAMDYEREGDLKNTLRHFESALEIALKYDDQRRVAYLLLVTAHVLRNSDTKRAADLLEKSWEIFKRLGYQEKGWGQLNMEGAVHNARGEFTAAIECYNTSMLQQQALHPYHSHRYLPANMAFVYNEIGNGEEALEWGRMALDSIPGHERIMAIANMRMARALIDLGRLKESSTHLERAHELVLEIGEEWPLCEYYLVSGLYERAQDDHATAIQSFERALEIAERIEVQNRINSCLLRLTESEVSQYDIAKKDTSREFSGPWMRKLDVMTREKDLPGILGLYLLLKAELRLKQMRVDEARDIIEDVRRMANNPGIAYLDEKALNLLSIVQQILE